MKKNVVINDDSINALKYFKESTVDLIYLDPPFYTQKKQTLSTRDGKKTFSFDDSWDSIRDYTKYIKERLVTCQKILKDTGSIFLHCDSSASHHLRVALDEVFGENQFRSEIIWSYKRWSNAKKGLLNNHQVIFFYSKTDNFKFNFFYEDYSPSTNIDQIVQLRERDNRNKSSYKKDEDGNVKICTEKKGVPLGDVWDIPYLNPKAKERVGYPTQKPILLIEKIINLVTSEGDIVVDPFCGSGTTLVAAKINNRKFIGFDISKDAVELANYRIMNPIKTDSKLLEKGRNSYKEIDPKVEKIIKQIGAIPVQRNKGIDGLVKSNNILVPVKIKREAESLDEAIEKLNKASAKNNYKEKFVFHFEDFDEKISSQHDVKIFNSLEQFYKEQSSL